MIALPSRGGARREALRRLVLATVLLAAPACGNNAPLHETETIEAVPGAPAPHPAIETEQQAIGQRQQCSAVRTLRVNDQRDFDPSVYLGPLGEQTVVTTITGPDAPRARCQSREARATTRATNAAAGACTAFCAGAGKTCLGRIAHADQSYHCALRDPTKPNTAENAPPEQGPDFVPDVGESDLQADPPAYIFGQASQMVGIFKANYTCQCSGP